MHRTASPRGRGVGDGLEVIGPAESAQDRDRRVVQADADADAGRAEMAQLVGELEQLADIRLDLVAPLAGEDAGSAQILDQLSRKAFGCFGFRGPGDHLLVEHLAQQCAVPGNIEGDGCGHDRATSRFRLTSSRRSLPDDRPRQRSRRDEYDI